MTQTETNGISRRRLLAMGGLSTGAALLCQGMAFANADENAPSSAKPATNSGRELFYL